MSPLVILATEDISIHALREEGDSLLNGRFHGGKKFLSTPSARRATRFFAITVVSYQHFYPRPPRGGRLRTSVIIGVRIGISIHALREEGDCRCRRCGGLLTSISIHALREEGDRLRRCSCLRRSYFYPRPPRGGRQNVLAKLVQLVKVFLSTPSARRATKRACKTGPAGQGISIHALREEGDYFKAPATGATYLFLSTPSARRATSRLWSRSASSKHFYPRPPRGGRLHANAAPEAAICISIHALREEGDRGLREALGFFVVFLSTPSARRATARHHRRQA